MIELVLHSGDELRVRMDTGTLTVANGNFTFIPLNQCPSCANTGTIRKVGAVDVCVVCGYKQTEFPGRVGSFVNDGGQQPR